MTYEAKKHMGEPDQVTRSWPILAGSPPVAPRDADAFDHCDASGGPWLRSDPLRERLRAFLAIRQRGMYHAFPYIELLVEIVKCNRANTPVSALDLGYRTKIAQTTALGTIDEMEEAGLILRTLDVSNRREVTIVPTETGLEVVRDFVERLLAEIPDMD